MHVLFTGFVRSSISCNRKSERRRNVYKTMFYSFVWKSELEVELCKINSQNFDRWTKIDQPENMYKPFATTWNRQELFNNSTWFYYYDVETKQLSSQRKSKSLQKQKKSATEQIECECNSHSFFKGLDSVRYKFVLSSQRANRKFCLTYENQWERDNRNFGAKGIGLFTTTIALYTQSDVSVHTFLDKKKNPHRFYSLQPLLISMEQKLFSCVEFGSYFERNPVLISGRNEKKHVR